MDDFDDVLVSAAEFAKDRLYFVTLRTSEKPRPTSCTHYFTVEKLLNYESFFTDFGPLNISMLQTYCAKLNKKLNANILKTKRIVHTTTDDSKNRLNAACLIGCFAIIYLDYTPQKAYDILNMNNKTPYIEFRDASVGEPYTISLFDCLCGFYKAKNLGFFNFNNFNSVQYEFYERVENGDLNWIVPDRFLGFCGPHNNSRVLGGYPLHAPEFYFNYFRRHRVTTIIRLNKKMYDSNKFVNGGFDHFDLYFVDGSTPSEKILHDFLNICEKAQGAIAVHCKAGLGRTGTLIGCYLMKHYQFNAKEAIGWIRMCRPGSVIGHQQVWLESKQEQMWKEGDLYRRKKGITSILKHKKGIYADMEDDDEDEEDDGIAVCESEDQDDVQQVSGILKKVDTMKLNDKEDMVKAEENSSPMTQGDELNQIKMLRRYARPLTVRPNNERKVFRTRVLVSPVATTTAPTMIRRTATKITVSPMTPLKITSSSTPASTTTATTTTTTPISRVLTTKRTTDELTPRRTSQRKIISMTASAATSSPALKVSTPKSNENGWHMQQYETEKKETKLIKRGKRSLNNEKEKSAPVKVLRRSNPNSHIDKMTTRPKLSLPVVKNNNNKTL